MSGYGRVFDYDNYGNPKVELLGGDHQLRGRSSRPRKVIVTKVPEHIGNLLKGDYVAFGNPSKCLRKYDVCPFAKKLDGLPGSPKTQEQVYAARPSPSSAERSIENIFW